MYSKMSYQDRNAHLKAMLKDQTILIFPQEGLQQIDGMPNLGIIMTDLRNAMTKKSNKVKSSTRVQFKQKTDTGIKKKDSHYEDEDNKTNATATFDPKTFKGSSDLYKHMTEYQLTMMQDQVPAKSPSLNLKKKKKTTFNDDYGVSLPEEDIERNRMGDSDAISQDNDETSQ